jgi:hypothetical protein
MTDKPAMTATELRKAVSEWAAQGFAVKLDTRTGIAEITPQQVHSVADAIQPVDLIQWGKR